MSEQEEKVEITPLGVSVLEAYIDAYMRKHPEVTSREEARKAILEK